MYAWSTTPEAIIAAAEEVGLRVNGPDRVGKTERSALTFTLALDTARRRPDGTLPYQRVSQHPSLGRYGRQFAPAGKHRRIGAVCWHGHRDFMRALYRRSPDMRLKTALADYRGAEHFEQTHRATFGETNAYNVGVLPYGQACTCTEPESAPGVTVYDGGEAAGFDRYTAFYDDGDMALAIGETGNVPGGVCMHVTAERGPHLGDVVPLADLPEPVRRAVEEAMA